MQSYSASVSAVLENQEYQNRAKLEEPTIKGGLAKGDDDEKIEKLDKAGVAATAASCLDPVKQTEYLNKFSLAVYEEIGLDINTEYNRMRRYKSAIEHLMLFWYKQRTYNAWAHLRIQIAKCEEGRCHTAAFRLQKFLRTALVNKEETERRMYLRMQMEAERKRLEGIRRVREASADVISRHIRRIAFTSYLARKLAKKAAALHIQKRMRGTLIYTHIHAYTRIYTYTRIFLIYTHIHSYYSYTLTLLIYTHIHSYTLIYTHIHSYHSYY